MDWAAWYCLGVLAVGIVVMAFDIMGPDFAMMAMLITMMLPGERVVSVHRALEGFSNEGLLTVGVLFVMAAGISETGGLDYAFTQLLGTPKTTSEALVRLTLPVIFIGAWLNNTPLVLILIPIVASWSRKAGLAPGHLFMPLSFASILGGTATLIGTSTNLVIAGKQRDSFPDDPPIHLFDVTPFGVPVALAGVLYIVIFGPRLLPGKAKSVADSDAEPLASAFLVGMQVCSGSPAAGRTVAEAGLRGLGGVFLTSVRRRGTVSHAVGPDHLLATGDVLFFAGDLSKLSAVAARLRLTAVADAFEEDLPALMGCARRRSGVSKASGASDAGSGHEPGAVTEPLIGSPAASTASPRQMHAESLRRLSALPPTRLMQARVAAAAPDLIDVSVRDAAFREKFHAAIVSIRRAGACLNGKMGDVVLRAGDELLFDCGAGFDAASPAAAANLTDVTAVESAAGQEFMVAFEVLGKGGRRALADEPPVLPPARGGGGLLDVGTVAGKSIAAAGLRGLPDAFLVTLERGDTTLHAVQPSAVLQAGDVLWFAAGTEGIISLRKIPGLMEVGDQVEKLSAGVLDRRLVQVVLGRSSDLLGRRVRDTHFRSRFDAAIIALHREGSRLREHIGDTTLAAGDVLLLDTGSRFLSSHRGDRNFALVAEVSNSQPPRFDRLALALTCAAAAIAIYIAGLIHLFTAAATASAVMLAAGCLSADAARRSIKWEVVVTIAAAFGISNALENTGAATAIAHALAAAGRAAGGTVAIQVSMYLGTATLANIVSNNAAAALMYPIAISVAQDEGLDKPRTAYLLMLAASASFAVPFAYQTNLMVYGAGGYTFKDFLRFGGPLQIVVAVASLGVIVLHEHLISITAALAAATVVVCAWPALSERLRQRRGRDPQRTESLESGPSLQGVDAAFV